MKQLIITLIFVSIRTISFSQDDNNLISELFQLIEKNDLVGNELNNLHKELELYSVKILWLDEPPGKLQGVIFSITDSIFIESILFDIPENSIFDVDRLWKMDDIKRSKVHSIRLMNRNDLIMEIKI